MSSSTTGSAGTTTSSTACSRQRSCAWGKTRNKWSGSAAMMLIKQKTFRRKSSIRALRSGENADGGREGGRQDRPGNLGAESAAAPGHALQATADDRH